CQIRSAPVLVLPRLQRFSITLKRRQRAKIKFILALCQQSGLFYCKKKLLPKGEFALTHLTEVFSLLTSL
ncbi:hypothetical protein ABE019_13595, partial [Bacillus altitudinis]|uniref:hypothetical protein n=1 Tax=Bacillus altitudinis TaxID=293387 RepID=UPI003D20A9DB